MHLRDAMAISPYFTSIFLAFPRLSILNVLGRKLQSEDIVIYIYAKIYIVHLSLKNEEHMLLYALNFNAQIRFINKILFIGLIFLTNVY